KVAEIESAADVVVWCCDEAPGFKLENAKARPQDASFVGNIVLAMDAYAQGSLGPLSILTQYAVWLIFIGNTSLMSAIWRASLEHWYDRNETRRLAGAENQCQSLRGGIGSGITAIPSSRSSRVSSPLATPRMFRCGTSL